MYGRVLAGRLIPLRHMLILTLAGFLSFAGCGKVDEVEVVKDKIRTIASLAEKKDSDKILSFLSSDYRDFQGRDIQLTAELLDYYFSNYQGIAIHLLDIYVNIFEDRAEAEADVLLSSGPLDTLRRLVGVAGVYYRFEFGLEKPAGRWTISRAAWREVQADSLLPGSAVILRKIFPEKY